MRLRIQQYGPSKSAVALSRYLGIKRLKRINSRFRPRSTDLIINWGKCQILPRARYLNSPEGVANASNKLSTIQILSSASVPVPAWTTSKPDSDEVLWVARTVIHGHSGEGIHVGLPSELPYAPLYTQFIDKVAEYRTIVVGDRIVDMKRKMRKRDTDQHPHIWNHSGGYVFAREAFEHAPTALHTISLAAMRALGLTYAAIDIIEDAEGNLYVLEINTAFGISGSTLNLVGDAIYELTTR